MTVIRIALLAVLLGSGVAALIWFGWGAIQALASGLGKQTPPPDGSKETTRGTPPKPAKPA